MQIPPLRCGMTNVWERENTPASRKRRRSRAGRNFLLLSLRRGLAGCVSVVPSHRLEAETVRRIARHYRGTACARRRTFERSPHPSHNCHPAAKRRDLLVGNRSTKSEVCRSSPQPFLAVAYSVFHAAVSTHADPSASLRDDTRCGYDKRRGEDEGQRVGDDKDQTRLVQMLSSPRRFIRARILSTYKYLHPKNSWHDVSPDLLS